MATYYIHTSGNDTTGNGSYANPWLTISKAHTSASDGDTIIVKTSTSNYTFATQEFSKILYIVGEDVTEVTFSNISACNGWYTRTSSNFFVNNCTFANIIISANQGLFHHPDNSGNGTGDVTITDCIIHDITLYSTAGARTNIFDCTNASGAGTGTFTVNKCLVYNIIKDGAGSAHILYTYQKGNTYFINTTIYADGSLIDSFNFGNVGVAKVYQFNNCIIQGKSSSLAWGSSSTHSSTYSCFNNMTSIPAAITGGTGVITSDPLFVDPANGNFNLRPNSPCINTGTLI